MATLSDDILDLLTAYALDALDPDEVARVSAMLDRDPQIRVLLAELRVTADRMPYALPDAAPPADLRQKVLDRATGRGQAPVATQAPSARRSRGPRGWLAGFGALAAASLVAAVVAWAQLGSVRAELEQTRAALNAQIALNEQVAAVVIANPDQIVLRGDAGSGTVLRDPNGQLVFAANLPPLEEGRVYQLWLLAGGSPVSAGTFTVGDTGDGLLALSESAAIQGGDFAVTEEPGPSGSPGPTSPVLISSLPAS